jgi:predicted RNase H-like HicB family nuclease
LICHAVIIGKAAGNYSANVPDLQGCVAAGDTVAESEIRGAIRFHIEVFNRTVVAVPEPQHRAMY